jgi:AcrR family transcriptional regulator
MAEFSEAPPARRGRPGYDHETVLRRAIDLFIRQGYDGTSMGDLAKELGFTKSAIYHHVPSKSHLLEQALDEALDQLTAIIEAARSNTEGTAYDRLRSAVRGSVEILVSHLPAVTLLLRVRGNSEVELAALRRRRDLDDKLAELVTAAVAEGAIRDDIPADLASKLLFGMVNSLIEWVRPDGRYEPGVLADAVTAMAFDGLRR